VPAIANLLWHEVAAATAEPLALAGGGGPSGGQEETIHPSVRQSKSDSKMG